MTTTGPFIIAVSGSRSIADQSFVYSALDEEASYYMLLGYDLMFHLGDAKGVDLLALRWARENAIPRTIFFADAKGYEVWAQSVHLMSDPTLEQAFLASDWESRQDGKDAGRIRNYAMIGGMDDDRGKSRRADLLIAIHPAEITPGTRNAKSTARTNGVMIHTHEYKTEG